VALSGAFILNKKPLSILKGTPLAQEHLCGEFIPPFTQMHAQVEKQFLFDTSKRVDRDQENL